MRTTGVAGAAVPSRASSSAASRLAILKSETMTV
jgi:hypothetical protein